MRDLIFESARTVTQDEFADWVHMREYWRIDNRARAVRVCAGEGQSAERFGQERVYGAGERVASVAREGLEIAVDELFP